MKNYNTDAAFLEDALALLLRVADHLSSATGEGARLREDVREWLEFYGEG